MNMKRALLAFAAALVALTVGAPAAGAAHGTTPTAVQVMAATDPNNFDPSFGGHTCVQIPNKRAYECAYGHTYWSVNLNTIQWDNHPPGNLLWIHADTLIASPLTNPPNPWAYFKVTIAGPLGGCEVVDPGYDENPTQCAEDGGSGLVQQMTPVQQASYNDFADQIVDMGAPDFAWTDAPGM